LALAALALNLSLIQSASAWYFTNTGSLNTPREFHTATLLSNGKVLVAGGRNNLVFSPAPSCMIPPPAHGGNTGSLGTARLQHTATLLPNGRVLVAAGNVNGGGITNSAELYDPATGVWARLAHCCRALRPHGDVARWRPGAGRWRCHFRQLAYGSELYDPAPAGTWATNGVLNTGRSYHTATLLANGKVLVVAALAATSSPLRVRELYDPANGTWTNTGSLNIARWKHTATLLPNGQVAGRRRAERQRHSLQRACQRGAVRPNTGHWTVTNSLTETRSSQTATLLPDGTVLVADGAGTNLNPAPCFMTRKWKLDDSHQFTNTWRTDHTATLLANGQVLFAGGETTNGTQRFQRGTFRFSQWSVDKHWPAEQCTRISHGNVAIRRESLGNWG